MPDHRCHRGAHPEDPRLFAELCRPSMSRAAADLAWMLSRGYARSSALKLVGDRYALEARQREAVSRCCCSDTQKKGRCGKRSRSGDLAMGNLWVDAFNVIATVESALSGGLILEGRDGCYRDLAGVHGTYRPVVETLPSLQLIGDTLQRYQVASCRWLLDRPVSNSGRLGEYLLQCARKNGWRWEVELVNNPDRLLMQSSATVASSDSLILDHCAAWFGLARSVVEQEVPAAWILRLFPEEE